MRKEKSNVELKSSKYIIHVINFIFDLHILLFNLMLICYLFDQESYESQLAQVRQRCVLILGSLGGSVNNVLVTSSAEELSKAAVAWDNVKHLKFDMPFTDIKPVIYFGKLGNRQSRFCNIKKITNKY
jgi:hypothetical protein